jgi:hypothetical protein
VFVSRVLNPIILPGYGEWVSSSSSSGTCNPRTKGREIRTFERHRGHGQRSMVLCITCWALNDDDDWVGFDRSEFSGLVAEVTIQESKLKVLDCKTQLVTKDPYGEVHGGSLTLQCPIPESVSLVNRKLLRRGWKIRCVRTYLDFLGSKNCEVFMVPIWVTSDSVFGLLLERAKEPGTYHRVGLYKMERSNKLRPVKKGSIKYEREAAIDSSLLITITII